MSNSSTLSGNTSSLRKLAIRGTVWTVASYGFSQILRLGSNLLLTRLLFPEVFGLMALVHTFITALHLFSDIGVGPSVIQNKRGDDPDFLNTAWTMQIVRSFGLWFCCVLIAWPAAKFYGEPQLLWLIPVVGLNTIISGFNSTAVYTLNRHVAVSQLPIFETGIQVISITVMVVWAWLSPTVWALVGGGFVSALVQLVWSHRLLSSFANRFTWDRDAAKEIFSFGKWIFISTVITFFAEQTDRLMIGKLFSIETLGVYGIALTLADSPRTISMVLGNKVIFPVISKQIDLPRETLRAKIIRNRYPILIAFALGLTVLVCFGDILISFLYDERYADAAWIVPVLALGIWPEVLSNTVCPSLFALGKPQYLTVATFSRFIWTLLGGLLGYSVMGFAGVVIAVALNDLLNYGITSYGLWYERLSVIKQDIQVTLLFVILITIGLICRFVLGFGLPIDSFVH